MRLIISLLGLVMLAAGAYIGYIVLLDEPDEVIGKPNGLESIDAVGAVDPPSEGEFRAFGAESGGLQCIDPNPTFEGRVIEFEYPEEFRNGEAGTVRLGYKTTADSSDVPVLEGNVVSTTAILESTYFDTHNGFARATVTAPDFTIESESSEEQQIRSGESLQWLWSLTPEQSGELDVIVTLRVRWVPKDPSSGLCEVVDEWSDARTIETVDVFGFLTIPQASLGGTVLAILGFVTQLPLLNEILGFFVGRRLDKREERRRQRRNRRRR
jgi:hypothetical protein